MKGLRHPEQKLGKNPYSAWIYLLKDSGAVVNGECTCVARYVKFLFSKFIMIITLIIVTIYNKNVKLIVSDKPTQTIVCVFVLVLL